MPMYINGDAIGLSGCQAANARHGRLIIPHSQRIGLSALLTRRRAAALVPRATRFSQMFGMPFPMDLAYAPSPLMVANQRRARQTDPLPRMAIACAFHGRSTDRHSRKHRQAFRA